MAPLLTAGQMRAAEQAAITSGAVTGLALMERAGQGVVTAILDQWPELAGTSGQRALILCGPGNNGGDGFVVARLLAAQGWQIDLRLFGDPARLPGDARANHDRWSGDVRPWRAEEAPDLSGYALVVDALFGTGLTRGLPDGAGFARTLAWRDDGSSRPRVVAIDMPSGLCSDSGRVLGDAALRADLAVTFHTAKPGHVLADGPAHCGRVHVVDIGLPVAAAEEGVAGLITGPGALDKGGTAHKYSHGHALVLSGGAGRSGAARLAARGALRIGAGLVTLGVPGSAQMEVACQVTALMLRRVNDGPGLVDVLADGRLSALCIGPGLGLDRAPELVAAALGGAVETRPMVLDADALTAFGDRPDTLFEMVHPGCVLTPHGGEFARLFPDLAARLAEPSATGPAFSRIDAARLAAGRAGAVVLLKGPDTVIAAPDGRCAVQSAAYDRQAPWLATAGAGDVLAGFITGLLARGFDPFDAACAGAWLHVETARRFGPGLIAEDLPDLLPDVLRRLAG
ncbi:NAD(P)H-hydrate dehydratase [Marinibacterium sp. SX1]|uniref:NAD(P)H-hydrate dehydratase n=1 Tax=Marinibacterium sp. SX1 TaxID=3388424 RepID=UPI003D166EC3